ncbi:hypothetical protein ACH5RR_031796 [Cinchona calisaya]|uniref:Ubiquitin-like domain-containing protein n=1 Tax=Cinchona calisaya TaxID=153742 RepID=A0ABD2YG88_9GENT
MAGGDNKKRPLKELVMAKRKILLKIHGQDGSLVNIQMKRDTPLKKLFTKYCDEKKMDYSAMSFIYYGQRLHVMRSPNELQMEDGDIIEAYVQVNGGGHQEVGGGLEEKGVARGKRSKGPCMLVGTARDVAGERETLEEKGGVEQGVARERLEMVGFHFQGRLQWMGIKEGALAKDLF